MQEFGALLEPYNGNRCLGQEGEARLCIFYQQKRCKNMRFLSVTLSVRPPKKEDWKPARISTLSKFYKRHGSEHQLARKLKYLERSKVASFKIRILEGLKGNRGIGYLL